LLAAWRAGLSVAAVPMLWRATELARVCEMIEPAGLLGTSSYAGARPASLLRDVAARRLSIRFVMGFGPDLPDGVSSLDDAILDGPGPGFVSRANPGPALITFTARAGEPLVPIFRQQQDVLLQGAMNVMAPVARPPRYPPQSFSAHRPRRHRHGTRTLADRRDRPRAARPL
jgi:hypothetical protein